MRRRHRPRVVVYTRQRCGLCEAAERQVRAEARRAEVELVDVDSDPELQRRYHLRVPVVVVDGVEVGELQLVPGQVRAAVRAARRARPPDGAGRDHR